MCGRYASSRKADDLVSYFEVQDPPEEVLPASWNVGPPLVVPPKVYATWAGARLFRPGYEQECGFDGAKFSCRSAR